MYKHSLAPIDPQQSRRIIRNRKLFSVVMLTAVMTAIIIVMAIPPAPVMAKSEPANAAAKIGNINVNDGFAELVKAVKPAVVNISVIGHTKAGSQGLPFNFEGQSPQLEEFFKRFFGEQPNMPGGNQQNQGEQPAERKTRAVGSGFIVDPEGLVVTNYHVIEGADEIEVVFDDGTRVPASLKGTDQKTDLALLEIDTDRILPYVAFGESDDAEVGDWVIAIGNPFGLGGTTTSGIISARGRDIRSGPLDDFIQINGGSVGIGFAIPSSMANNVITQLQENGTVQRGYLGVHIQSITEEIAESLGLDDTSGALVSQVMEDSPAEKAGIESGDVILSYGGKKLNKMRDLPKLVALTAKDTEVDIEIWRNDQYKTLRADISSNDEPRLASALTNDKMSPSLGLSLASLDSKKIEKYGLDENAVGVVVVDVAPNSSAAERGLREGDLIKRVGKTDVSSPDDVVNAIASSREDSKDSVLLLVERDSQARFIVVPMET
jgi:serine protease Do